MKTRIKILATLCAILIATNLLTMLQLTEKTDELNRANRVITSLHESRAEQSEVIGQQDKQNQKLKKQIKKLKKRIKKKESKIRKLNEQVNSLTGSYIGTFRATTYCWHCDSERPTASGRYAVPGYTVAIGAGTGLQLGDKVRLKGDGWDGVYRVDDICGIAGTIDIYRSSDGYCACNYCGRVEVYKL